MLVPSGVGAPGGEEDEEREEDQEEEEGGESEGSGRGRGRSQEAATTQPWKPAEEAHDEPAVQDENETSVTTVLSVGGEKRREEEKRRGLDEGEVNAVMTTSLCTTSIYWGMVQICLSNLQFCVRLIQTRS